MNNDNKTFQQQQEEEEGRVNNLPQNFATENIPEYFNSIEEVNNLPVKLTKKQKEVVKLM